MSNIQAGLFGFGVVGEGIFEVLHQKPQLGIDIRKVVIKDPAKPRNAPAQLFSVDRRDVLADPDISLVIELIDDADAALEIVLEAMNAGKSVISANKKMIANHHNHLLDTARQNGVSFLYEAAVCGSIPIIRNLEEYFDNDLLTYVKGIVNGSTNYILSQMTSGGMDYASALRLAQEKGFAESDPSLDVEGFDAVNKLAIIILHAFGKQVPLDKLIRKGITGLDPFDFRYAREKGLVIKLLASCAVSEAGGLARVSVLPTFLPASHALSGTNNEYNGVLVGSSLADEQCFVGKGAGRYPTSSAVLSDISAYKYHYRYEFKKGLSHAEPGLSESVKVYVSYPVNGKLDLSLFEEVEETYQSANRAYAIGKVPASGLGQLTERQDLSLIAFE